MTSPRTGATATSKDGLDLCRAYFFRVWRKEIKEALLAGWVRVFLHFTTFTSHSFDILFLTDQMKGFVSIFQLLGRYVRRISVVFHRNFARRDNQHVWFSFHKQPVRLQILRKFVVHKPHTRKTCFTEPLRRIIEPLRRNTEPHCEIIEPLRRNVDIYIYIYFVGNNYIQSSTVITPTLN